MAAVNSKMWGFALAWAIAMVLANPGPVSAQSGLEWKILSGDAAVMLDTDGATFTNNLAANGIDTSDDGNIPTVACMEVPANFSSKPYACQRGLLTLLNCSKDINVAVQAQNYSTGQLYLTDAPTIASGTTRTFNCPTGVCTFAVGGSSIKSPLTSGYWVLVPPFGTPTNNFAVLKTTNAEWMKKGCNYYYAYETQMMVNQTQKMIYNSIKSLAK